MKKIVIALAAAVLGITLTCTSANASDLQYTNVHCQKYTNSWGNWANFCVHFSYRKQDDGTGWRVEDMWENIDQNVNILEGDPKVKYMRVDTYDPLYYNQSTPQATTAGDSSFDPAGHSFDIHRDLELKNGDTGGLWIDFKQEINLNNAPNQTQFFSFTPVD